MKKLLLVTMMAAATVASAAVIPTFDRVEPTGANYTYFYTVGLLENTKLDPAEQEEQVVIIYDFAGYTGVSGSLSGNWDVTTRLTGPSYVTDPNYPRVDPEIGDDSEILNLVFTYTGPPVFADDDDFDTIFAESRFNEQQLDTFRGQGTKNTPAVPAENNTPAGSSGEVTVPTGEDTNPIPEPATMSLLGSALVGLGLLRLRRK